MPVKRGARTFSYTRVSHRDSLGGPSLDTQNAMMEPYRLSNKLPKFHWQDGLRGQGKYEDRAVSAWRYDLNDRPQGRLMLSRVQAGDHILFPYMDRAFRSVRDWSIMQKVWTDNDVSIHFVRQGLNMHSAAGKLICNVLASYAQFRSDLLSERLRMQRLDKKYASTSAVETYRESASRRQKLVIPQPLVDVNIRIHELRREAGRLPVRAVYGYIRCSTVEQVESGRTLPHQRQTVEDCARRLLKGERDLDHVFVDEGVSAWRTDFVDRPSGGLLNDMLCRGDHIIVAKLDRAFRSLRDMASTLEAWRAMGVVVHFADSGLRSDELEGRLLMGILGVLAEYESQMLSESVAAGLSRSNRVSADMLPYYLKVDTDSLGMGTVSVNYDTLAVCEKIFHLYHVEGLGRRRIYNAIERDRAAKYGCHPIPHDGVKRNEADKYGVSHGCYVLRNRWFPQFSDYRIKRLLKGGVEIMQETVSVLEGHGDIEKLAMLKLAKRAVSEINPVRDLRVASSYASARPPLAVTEYSDICPEIQDLYPPRT